MHLQQQLAAELLFCRVALRQEGLGDEFSHQRLAYARRPGEVHEERPRHLLARSGAPPQGLAEGLANGRVVRVHNVGILGEVRVALDVGRYRLFDRPPCQRLPGKVGI